MPQLLDSVHDGLYQRAKKNLEDHTKTCLTAEEVKDFIQNEGGFARTMWCGDEACELKMKEIAGVSPAACPLLRRRCPTPACAAASLPST